MKTRAVAPPGNEAASMRYRYLLSIALALACVAPGYAAQPAPAAPDPSPHAIDIPPWFRETFLDFREDIREAAKAQRRLMIYFGQDGCPYCRQLMRVNFDRSHRPAAKPLAVLFEQKHCAACDEMHALGFKDQATLALIGKFDAENIRERGGKIDLW